MEAASLLNPLIAALSGLAGVGVGGWLSHHWSASRDLANERRKLRISYLLEAYRRLEASANRPVGTPEQKAAFESAVADIQLLGTNDQIETTLQYVTKHAQDGGAIIDPVLEILRADLRQEMGLRGGAPRVHVFRFKDDRG